MEFTPTPFVYVFIGLMTGLIIGWVIGFFDSNNRTSKKIQVAEEKAKMQIGEAEKKAAQLEQKYEEASAVQDDPGLLRLKKNNGRYILEMDGAPVPPELNQDMRRRLIELLTIFRLWLEPGKFSPASPPTPPMPAPVRVTVPNPAPVSPPPAPVREAVSNPAPASASPLPAAIAKKSEPEKNIASLSIVQQIDTVLQGHLMKSHLAKRGIRLQESIQGGVEVYVGLQKFQSVDDVPDEEIKSFIRAAIAEWEKKYTPGM